MFILEHLTNNQKDAIASVMIIQKFTKNSHIVCKGDIGSSYYIIKEGTVAVMNDEREIRKLGKGDAFGEQALYFNSTRTMSIRADTETICLALARDTLNQILGEKLQVIVFRNLQKWALEKSKYLSKLNSLQIEKIIQCMNITTFENEQIVFQKGQQTNPKMVIVLEGYLKKQKTKETICGKGKIVGEDYLTARSKDIKLTDGIVTSKNTILASFSRQEFIELFECSLEELVTKTEKNQIEHTNLQEEKKNNFSEEAGKIKFNDMKCIAKLGSGQFGNVFAVTVNDKDIYALKCVSKAMIHAQGIENHIKVCFLILKLAREASTGNHSASFYSADD